MNIKILITVNFDHFLKPIKNINLYFFLKLLPKHKSTENFLNFLKILKLKYLKIN